MKGQITAVEKTQLFGASSIGVFLYSPQYELKHHTRCSRMSIRYRRFHSVQDLHHQIPVSGRETAWELLLDRQLDILRDQPSACCKEDGRIRYGRLEYCFTTFIGPDLGKVFQERLAEGGAAPNGTAAQVS